MYVKFGPVFLASTLVVLGISLMVPGGMVPGAHPKLGGTKDGLPNASDPLPRALPHERSVGRHALTPTELRPILGTGSPLLSATPPQTTSINGTVSIDGTLLSNDTRLSGGFEAVGSATTSGFTSTTGTAGYGTTRVLGGLTITGTPGSALPALVTNPGSSLFMDPPSSTVGATISMQGNLALGNGSTGDTFLLNQQGTPMSVWSNASGGIYGLNGQTTITSGSNIVVTNYGPGTLTINGCILVCPITIPAGSTYTPCYPIIGCISASSSSITWTGPIYFNIQGTVSTSSPGLYAEFPESHLSITVPVGVGANFSMLPAQGNPTIQVTRGSVTPAYVSTYGDLLMTGGEQLAANVSVNGTFAAADHVFVNGTFQNLGGLTIYGQMSSWGAQYFPGHLFLGPVFHVTTAPGSNITVQGHIIGDSSGNGTDTINLVGSMISSGNLSLQGYFQQNSTVSNITGNLSTGGTLYASGSIVTTGKTEFLGTFLAQGNLSLPNTFLGGRLSATWCTLIGLGSTDLTGTLSVIGSTEIMNGSFTSSGTSSIRGNIVGNKNDTLTGNSTMTTLWGENLSLTSHVTLGGVATIVGSIGVQGVISTNGTSTFTATAVDIASAVTVNGSSYSTGSVDVDGTTFFTGEVRTSGVSNFPGMNLTGNFSLASTGGSVFAQGTSRVQGTVTLSGLLEVTPPNGTTPGVFHEAGYSSITGNLKMTGKVVVTGHTQLTTSSGALLYMWGDIELGTAAYIQGDVNVSGEVSITGSATLTNDLVQINGTLDQVGEVFSSGDITLIGEASFNGSVDTFGTTVLPGIFTAGSLQIPAGNFIIHGVIGLQGSTTAFGNVTVNSTGYYVVGSDTIRGRSAATGSFSESGHSVLTGYADIGPGSRFGTYMKVVGQMNTGGLSLSGTTILPDDEVTFTDGANITGTSTMDGLLTGIGSSVTFQGSSVVTGTVTSPTMPEIFGPVVLSLLGGYFAITLGTEFYLFIGATVLALVEGVTQGFLGLRAKWKRLPRPQVSLLARLSRVLGILLTIAGAVSGLGGGFLLGSALASQPMSANPASVSLLYWASSGVMVAGIVLWVVGSLLIRRERRTHLRAWTRAPPPPPAFSPLPPEFQPTLEVPSPWGPQ